MKHATPRQRSGNKSSVIAPITDPAGLIHRRRKWHPGTEG